MTDDLDRIQRLLQSYEELEGDRRWAILSEFETIIDRHPDKLTPQFDWFIGQFRQAKGGMKKRIGNIILQLIDDRPELALTAIHELSGQLPSAGDVTREIVYEAVFIVKAKQPDKLWGALPASDIEPLLEGDIDARVEAYDLLAAVGGPASIRLLLGWRDEEAGDTATAVEQAMKEIVQRASKRLEERSTSSAAECLKLAAENSPHLAGDQINILLDTVLADTDPLSEIAADALVALGESDTVVTGLDSWEMVDKMDTVKQPAYGRVVGAVVAGESKDFDDLLNELVSRLHGMNTESGQAQLLAALVEAVRIRKPDSFPALDETLHLEAEIVDSNRAGYIELLGEIASSVASPGRVIPDLVDALQSESVNVRREAARGLVLAQIYPVPGALEASQEDPDQTVRELAGAASGQSPQKNILPLEFSPDAESQITGMSADLKYQTAPGRWDPVEIDEYHRTLLQNISLASQSGGSSQIQLPYYEPQAGLLTVLELTLQARDDSSTHQIALYSPGTRTHWGTLGDIRDAVSRFGFGDNNIRGYALPFDEYVTLSRVQEDSVEPYSESTNSDNELVITKSIDGLASIESPDAIVCNLQARAPRDGDDLVEKIRSVSPDTPLFLQYSFFTKHEHDHGWPRYGFPQELPTGVTASISRFPVRAISASDDTGGDESAITPAGRARQQLDRLGRSRPITVHELGGDAITEPLKEIYRHYKDIDEPETAELASAIQNRLYGIRRLPVPVDIYNDWVHQESLSHGRFAPDTTQQLLHSLEQFSEQYDLAYVPATVQSVVEQLEELYDALESHNPKFSFLIELIEKNIETENQIAILFLSQQMLRVFRYGIRETTGYDTEELEARGIYLSRPDQFRNLQPIDRLVLVNDIPAALASFYFSPGAENIDLLNFGYSDSSLLSDWVKQHSQKIHEQLRIPTDVDWPALPALSQENHGMEKEATQPEEDVPIPRPDFATESQSRSPDQLAGEFGSEGYSAAPVTVEITTRAGSRVKLDSNQSVLLEQRQNGATEYVWISARDLAEEDTFVVIPDNVRRTLYEETLQELYKEELSDLAYMNSLGLWWETMREIHEEYASTDIIYSLLKRNGLEKSAAAVKDWFRAVNAAEKPLDLVEHPELTIGPDSASDILVIGETFDQDELVQQAGLIQNVMERFREENRERGRELNEQIISMIEDPSSELSSDAVTHVAEQIEYHS